MSLRDCEILELNELCNAVVDSNLTEAQRQRLESWLATSEEARAYYIKTMDLSAALAHRAAEMQMEAPDAAGRSLWFLQFARWHWISLAAAAILGITIVWELRPKLINPTAVAEPMEYVARITGENGVVWKAGDEFKRGSFLHRGQRIEISQGFAEITFDSGAVVLLEGPAAFDVNSAWASTLRRGAVNVNVPHQAIGFRVSTSAVDFDDLGTEFSMIADGQGGADVVVLKGEVQASPRGHEDPEPVVLHANESRRFAESGMSRAQDEEELLARFSEPISLDRLTESTNFAHWSFDELMNGAFPAKVVGFPGGDLALTLQSKSPESLQLASIKGMRNRALHFDGELVGKAKFPGLSSNSEHTIAFWVKVPKDSLLSDAYSMVAWRANEGKLDSRPVHIAWNRDPSEGPLGAVRTDFSGGHAIGLTSLRDGRWHHICVIFLPGDDPATPVQVKQYVDGRLESNMITPGPKRSIGGNLNQVDNGTGTDVLWLGCRLGGTQPKRDRFSGDIDELFIADRGLEPAQVVQLMENADMIQSTPDD
ncbi:MAG TPA: LamG-like jellyroll fold domain-containing protein [Pirellulales bacterium]|jgi:hypothetical protein|nr:LamG-like jellyroll fold domain-containing protein [Pirellulales bacterium]